MPVVDSPSDIPSPSSRNIFKGFSYVAPSLILSP